MAESAGVKVLRKLLEDLLQELGFIRKKKFLVRKNGSLSVCVWVELLGKKSPGDLEISVGLFSENMLRRMGLYFEFTDESCCLVSTGIQLFNSFNKEEGYSPIDLPLWEHVVTESEGVEYFEKVRGILVDWIIPKLLAIDDEEALIEWVGTNPYGFRTYVSRVKWEECVSRYRESISP